MFRQSKSWLLQNKLSKSLIIFCLAALFSYRAASQIANYVNNGSFEDIYACNTFSQDISVAKYWRSVDSTCYGGIICNTCTGLGTAPLNGNTYQWPKSGQSYALGTLYCQSPTCPDNNRGHFRNRLKGNLQSGKTYCVKFYVNICNTSTYGMDGFGAYFGDNSLDTISKCDRHLPFLIPHIQNPVNNLITDTLNWIPVTGTFVATGTEKHVVIGNFRSNASTNTVMINTNLPGVYTDVCIDDVSCIDVDLPAFAGPDLYCIPGNSVYLGRQKDVGIDEACMWYQLPNLTTAIDTAAGIAVSPVVTTTYVVRQEICAGIRWDTVVVYASGVGIKNESYALQDLRLYPVPASDVLKLELNEESLGRKFTRVKIQNNLGQQVKYVELSFINKKAEIEINYLPDGLYFLGFESDNAAIVQKRFTIAR